MKTLYACVFLLAGASLAHGAIVQNISINLNTLHPGSTLSGTFTLPDNPVAGNTAPVQLNFSDPGDYTPTSLSATISIQTGTTGLAVVFSPLSFTNPSGNSFTRNVNLTVAGAAQCSSFPCTATGRFDDGSPAVFSSTYTITPGSAVPEPGYSAMLLASFGLLATGRQYLRRAK